MTQLEQTIDLEWDVDSILEGVLPARSRTTEAIASGNCRLIVHDELANEDAD